MPLVDMKREILLIAGGGMLVLWQVANIALLHNFQSGGLILQWYELERRAATIYVVRSHSNRQLEPDTDSEPTIPTVVWCGWFVSVVVFICELIWYRF